MCPHFLTQQQNGRLAHHTDLLLMDRTFWVAVSFTEMLEQFSSLGLFWANHCLKYKKTIQAFSAGFWRRDASHESFLRLQTTPQCLLLNLPAEASLRQQISIQYHQRCTVHLASPHLGRSGVSRLWIAYLVQSPDQGDGGWGKSCGGRDSILTS